MKSAVLESGPQQAEAYGSYGSAQALSLAHMILAAGHTNVLPDPEFVASFARSEQLTAGAEVPAVGAAASFMEGSFEVQAFGHDPNDVAATHPSINWGVMLNQSSRGVSHSTKLTSEILQQLMNPPDGRPWLIKIDVQHLERSDTIPDLRCSTLLQPIKTIQGPAHTAMHVFNAAEHQRVRSIMRQVTARSVLQQCISDESQLQVLAVRRRASTTQ